MTMSRELMGKIVDEVFDGAIEDASVIEGIYAAIKRHEAPAPAEHLRAALDKINDIRNSIIGFQTVNWSEHIYPLVATLEEAGFEGAGYPASRANVGTMLERTLAAENEADRLRAITLDLQKQYIAVTAALKPFAEAASRFDGLPVSETLPQQCWFSPHSLREARAALANTEGQP